MGNTLAKYCKTDWVDGGRVKEKISEDERPIMIDAWGAPIYAPKDYDTHLVKKLIRQRRLAPFYVAEENDSEETSSSSGSDDSFTNAKRTKSKAKKIKKNKANKDDPESLESSFFTEQLLREDFVDCPICLLAYPRNTNYTECCNQPMCTSCFVKIKRPGSGRVISCPFCNHVNFAIFYRKPRWLAELAKPEGQREDSVKPDPVACESVKPIVPAHERIQRLHGQQRNNQTQPRYYYSNRGSSNGTVPRRYVFYEPSGAYTFYDNQYYRAAAEPTAGPSEPDPSYYQHYRQQEYQRQQTLRARAEAYERQQLEAAIRRSMNDESEE